MEENKNSQNPIRSESPSVQTSNVQLNNNPSTPHKPKFKKSLLATTGVILFIIFILLAWSPWITKDLAYSIFKFQYTCDPLTVIPESSEPSSTKKVLFGRNLYGIEGSCSLSSDYFVSAIGTVHRLKSKSNIRITPSSTPTPDLTADWKTYTNSKYGFEFKYPPNLVIKDEENEYFILTLESKAPDPYFLIHTSVKTLPQKTDFLSYLKSLQYDNIQGSKVQIYKELKPYSIKTLNGYYYFGGYENMGWKVFFENQNKVYSFSFNESEAGVYDEPIKTKPNTLDQILSTFTFAPSSTSKFTDNQTIDTSTWKTYTNHGFTLKYPSDLEVEELNKDFSLVRFRNWESESKCISIDVNIVSDYSPDITSWIKNNRKRIMPDGETILTPEIKEYKNGDIEGFWIETGSESIGKSIFVKKESKYLEIGTPGCSTGDHYKFHTDTLAIMDNMIKLFKFTP